MPDDHDTRHSHLPPTDGRVADCGFAAVERDVLEIARRFFITFGAPASQSWLSAFDAAACAFPAPHAAAIAYEIAALLRVLRMTRRSTFSFINPNCVQCMGSIMQEERHLLSILKAVRRERRAEAALFAMIICDGADPAPVVAACERVHRAIAAAMPAPATQV